MSTEQIIVNDVAVQTSVAPVQPIEVQPVEVAVKQTKEKKPKKVSDSPKLAPKFQKYLYFGYWVALQLKNKNLINDDVFQTILTDIKMNDDVGVQTQFYTNYEKSGKPTVSPDAPSLTAEGVEGVAEVKPKAKKSRKPTGRDSTPDAPSLTAEGLEGVAEVKPKAKKARKPKATTEEVPVEGVEGVAEVKPKAKRARKPKATTEEVPVEGVEGVAEVKPKAAKKSRKPTGRDSTPDAPSLQVEGVEGVVEGGVEGGVEEVKPKAKRARKPKATTEEVPVEGLEEVKPKPKNARKPKATTHSADDIIHNLLVSSNTNVQDSNETPAVEVQKMNVDDDSEDEDISVSTIIINNEEYLIDDHFNLYHTKTHDNIGTFINQQLQLRTSYELTK